jgi:hypothetical protein
MRMVQAFASISVITARENSARFQVGSNRNPYLKPDKKQIPEKCTWYYEEPSLLSAIEKKTKEMMGNISSYASRTLMGSILLDPPRVS